MAMARNHVAVGHVWLETTDDRFTPRRKRRGTYIEGWRVRRSAEPMAVEINGGICSVQN